MLKFAEVLRTWWPHYVQAAEGPIPTRHWQAVEAVLSCRTSRRGGHRYYCPKCECDHYLYHSCNHRACPACGSREQQLWAEKQLRRMLPVPYYLLTSTVPEAMRNLFYFYPAELYPIFFAAVAQAIQSLLQQPKHLGGRAGFISVLHTWTRRLFFHPHLHVLVPAVGVAPDEVSLVFPPNPEFLLPVQKLSGAICLTFRSLLEALHPQLYSTLPDSLWQEQWVAHVQHAGSGRAALRYLAAYVKRSAFTEERLLGYDHAGRIILSYRESSDDSTRTEPIQPLELIRRWLLHVLPRGLMRVRHFGWLAPAAWQTFRRVRYLFGLPRWVPFSRPRLIPTCSRCQGTLQLIGPLAPARGPPLARSLLR